MSDLLFDAPPRSGESIEDLADAIRRMFDYDNDTYFPIVEFVEKALPVLVEGLVVDVVEPELMGRRMGAVNPVTREFLIRQDAYDGAVQHEPRHRFTLAHESGHALMHIGTLNRMNPSESVPIYRDPEWQANRFAAALLMPRKLVRNSRSISEVMARFGVSHECAEHRAAKLRLDIK